MAIASLQITDFRNLAAVKIAPSLFGLNVICGSNGSGKTSLLEAIHYLGLGRSFRSPLSSRLVRHAHDKFSLFTQIVSDGEQLVPIGIERELSGTSRMRVAEKDVTSMSELASFLPLRVINSQSHQLFESGPMYRRQFLDWGLFYQSNMFFPCWRNLERALKQRNILLREKRPKNELEVWTNEFVRYALELDALRRKYIQELEPILVDVTQQLLPIPQLEIIYQPGWPDSKHLASALMEDYLQELRIGYTQYGPHRADLEVKTNSNLVKHILSRGQQKLLICAMMLAQGILLAQHANKSLIYLIDDLPSELDLQSRQRLIALLSAQKTQIFITAIESEAICSLVETKWGVPIKVFHVEQGRVSEKIVGMG